MASPSSFSGTRPPNAAIVGVEAEEWGRALRDRRPAAREGAAVRQGDIAHIARARDIDLVDLLVRGRELRGHAHPAVIALENEKFVVVQSHEGRDAAPLARALHQVGVLRDRETGCVVELDDAVVAPVTETALVEHGALEHGVGELAVRADGQPFEPSVRALARRIARVVREVRHGGGAVATGVAIAGSQELRASTTAAARDRAFTDASSEGLVMSEQRGPSPLYQA